jgi:hypothetical protein
MKKVVINKCYGGFGLSPKADKLYLSKLCGVPIDIIEQSGFNYYINGIEHPHYSRMLSREDPILVEVVEELGDSADANYAKLRIVEIPEDVEYTIEEYDGMEWVAEEHRTWS